MGAVRLLTQFFADIKMFPEVHGQQHLCPNSFHEIIHCPVIFVLQTRVSRHTCHVDFSAFEQVDFPTIAVSDVVVEFVTFAVPMPPVQIPAWNTVRLPATFTTKATP